MGKDGRAGAVVLAVGIQGSLELASRRECRIKDLDGVLMSGLLHLLSSWRIT